MPKFAEKKAMTVSRIRDLAIAAFLLSFAAQADLIHPLRRTSELASPRRTSVVRVETARVVVADYLLIERDFPHLRGFSATAEGREKIDQFLLETAGYVTQEQAAQTVVNTPISLKKNFKGVVIRDQALQPELYHRGLVFRAKVPRDGAAALKKEEFLIDAKGVGTLVPEQKSHSNGLGTVGEFLREYRLEKVLQSALNLIHTPGTDPIRIVGAYAVIDFGFDVIHKDGSHSPAGALLRQAHTRTPIAMSSEYQMGNHFLPKKRAMEIERALRTLGVVSGGDYIALHTYDAMNVQGTADGHLVDLGAMLVVPGDLNRPVYTYVDAIEIARSEKYRKIHQPVFSPDAEDFPKPDTFYRLPFEEFGYSITGRPDPKMDNLWIWGHETAEKLRNGGLTPEDIQREVRSSVQRVGLRITCRPLL